MEAAKPMYAVTEPVGAALLSIHPGHPNQAKPTVVDQCCTPPRARLEMHGGIGPMIPGTYSILVATFATFAGAAAAAAAAGRPRQWRRPAVKK